MYTCMMGGVGTLKGLCNVKQSLIAKVLHPATGVDDTATSPSWEGRVGTLQYCTDQRRPLTSSHLLASLCISPGTFLPCRKPELCRVQSYGLD